MVASCQKYFQVRQSTQQSEIAIIDESFNFLPMLLWHKKLVLGILFKELPTSPHQELPDLGHLVSLATQLYFRHFLRSLKRSTLSSPF